MRRSGSDTFRYLKKKRTNDVIITFQQSSYLMHGNWYVWNTGSYLRHSPIKWQKWVFNSVGHTQGPNSTTMLNRLYFVVIVVLPNFSTLNYYFILIFEKNLNDAHHTSYIFFVKLFLFIDNFFLSNVLC
jgi:hypothetical protein